MYYTRQQYTLTFVKFYTSSGVKKYLPFWEHRSDIKIFCKLKIIIIIIKNLLQLIDIVAL